MSTAGAEPVMPGGARDLVVGPEIRIEGLSKAFGDIRAVDNVSFTAHPAEITCFLGPNGAGKTTTLRMLLGLVEPTSGTATIGGTSYGDLANPPDVVGAALEASSFHPGRSGRDHLRVYCTVAGYPDSRADEVLEVVGLGDAARRPVHAYSLGMRQRLGLATALLGDPPPPSARPSPGGPRPPPSEPRRCWSSTSRPTVSTPPASPGCVGSCAAS